MATFTVGETLTTREPEIEVTITPDRPLPVGRHVFQLTVEDDSRNMSQAATVEVIIRDTQAPTAVLDAPPQVELGQTFRLSGIRSSDVTPGRVVAYHWTLMPQPVIGPILTGPIIRPTDISIDSTLLTPR